MTNKTEASGILLVGPRYRTDTYKNEAAYEEMVAARTILLTETPFWGILAMNMRLVEDTTGKSIPTAATDGLHVFYNAEFMLKLSKGERIFVIAHEIYHALMSHVGIKGHRGIMHTEADLDDPAKAKEAIKKMSAWNYAADFVVNYALVEANVGKRVTTVPILYDPKYDHEWSAEEVYDDLINDPEKMKQIEQQGGTLDTHIEIEIVDGDEEGGSDGDQNGENGDGSSNNPYKVKMSRGEFDKLSEQWQDSLQTAAAAQKEAETRNSKSAGCIPSGLQIVLDELCNPKVDWRKALNRFVKATVQRGYSFARPDKKHFSGGMSIPGFRSRQYTMEAAVAVDASGSVNKDMLTKFISEIDGIMKQFPSYKITAWCFDGDVIRESVTSIEKGRGKMEDIKKFVSNVAGGGGTMFESNWEFMRERGLKPNVMILFTDGYPNGSWGVSGYCPTIFLVAGNSNTKAPFGMTLHYEDF